jgi:asparagine synthase (glutamine-hydrolysing)
MFMSGYLLTSQGDRMLMANSVEGRYPFLDHRLIEFAAKLPESFKMNGIDEKYILKKTMKGRIPESIISRPKQAYRAPASNSLIGEFSTDFIRNSIDTGSIQKTGIFNSELTANLLKKTNTTGTATELENMIVTAITSTQIFSRFFIEQKNNSGLNPFKTLQMSKKSNYDNKQTI